MNVCDICNRSGTGTFISSEQMREAVFANGFNPFELGLASGGLDLLGINKTSQYNHWKNTVVAQDTSDWNICSRCMAKLQPYLKGEPKPTGVKEATVSSDSVASAMAGAAVERKYKRTEKPLDIKTARETKEEGMRLFHEGLYDEAADKFKRAREMFAAEENEVEVAETVNNLGVVYRLQDKWDEAIAALEEARAAFVKMGDRNREAQTLGNLGGLYADKNERDKAKECLRQAVDLFAELGDKEHQGETLLALGVQRWKTGDRSGGLATYEAGLQILPMPTVKQKTLRNLFRVRNRLLGQKNSD